VAPPSDVAGEDGAAINIKNATRSESSLQAKAGVDVDPSIGGVAPHSAETQAGVMENREFHARDQAAAKANVPSGQVSDARDAVRNPSVTVETRAETRLQSEASERRPDAAVDAEQRAAQAQAAREVGHNPEAAAEAKANALADEKIDEKKVDAQASAGVKVTTKPTDGDT
jgi:hypothetical protein